MLETIASYLSGIWILLLLIAAIIKSPVLIGVFMCLYVVSMALWGISWLNKKYDVKRKMAAAKKTAKPTAFCSPSLSTFFIGLLPVSTNSVLHFPLLPLETFN